MRKYHRKYNNGYYDDCFDFDLLDMLFFWVFIIEDLFAPYADMDVYHHEHMSDFAEPNESVSHEENESDSHEEVDVEEGIIPLAEETSAEEEPVVEDVADSAESIDSTDDVIEIAPVVESAIIKDPDPLPAVDEPTRTYEPAPSYESPASSYSSGGYDSGGSSYDSGGSSYDSGGGGGD
jgi:hypothetical protein